MGAAVQKKAQIHVRVTQEFKRAVKMFCVRAGTTEQSWVLELTEAALAEQAPDLWPGSRTGRKNRTGRGTVKA